MCGTVYTIVTHAAPEAPVRAGPKIMKKPAVLADVIEAGASAETKAGNELVAEPDEEEAVAGDHDAFLEEVEEETPDVTSIVDAPIEPDEKS